MKKQKIFYSLRILCLMISFFILPKITYASSEFIEEFNSSLSNPDKWTVYENSDRGANITFLPNKIRLEPNGSAFPYLHTDTSVFPDGDFKVTISFQYLRSGPAWGDGIVISNQVPSNGEAPDPEHIIFSIWQDPAKKLRAGTAICPEDNSGCTKPLLLFQTSENDLNYHLLEVTLIDHQYEILIDDESKYISVPTTIRPNAIWMGHSLFTDHNDGWSNFEVDYIHVQSLEGVDVPYFPQKGAAWSNDIYDNAPAWDKHNDPTIGNYGCALTSAAMVLKSYGIETLPDRTPLDPGSLNNWLNTSYRKMNNGARARQIGRP